eukprot:TRINITY_DN14647_c0_g1_i1.p1 TRINITY_DN14647_c0_g1~~TRINITY_DN14647_c0_g1_i1.p1  ORF type:complete len:223 (+),score=32.70 TRINITY_DN14647_c0_g1_i1:65-670(+)
MADNHNNTSHRAEGEDKSGIPGEHGMKKVGHTIVDGIDNFFGKLGVGSHDHDAHAAKSPRKDNKAGENNQEHFGGDAFQRFNEKCKKAATDLGGGGAKVTNDVVAGGKEACTQNKEGQGGNKQPATSPKPADKPSTGGNNNENFGGDAFQGLNEKLKGATKELGETGGKATDEVVGAGKEACGGGDQANGAPPARPPKPSQ